MKVGAQALVLVVLAPLVGCSEPSVRLDRPGDPCRSLIAFCVDEETVMECVDEVWTPTSCADYCEGLAPGVSSEGCSTELLTDRCACAHPPGGCTPGETACEGDGTLSLCGDAWQWTSVPCEELCGQQAPPANSLGCGSVDNRGEEVDACLCTTEGLPCSNEPARCVDDQTLARCEGALWAYVRCDLECAGEAICDPSGSSDGEHACRCT